MHKEAFETLKGIEGTWWHRGRVLAVNRAIIKSGVSLSGKALDVGTGFGGMFDFLSSFGIVFGIEKDDGARKTASSRGYAEVTTTLDNLKERKFEVLGAFDVIEHIEDDESFVKELFEHTSKEGVLLATVPAFPFLFGEHDRKHMHFRRYTKKGFKNLLESAGYKVLYIGYWNRTLFPVAILMRLIGKGGEGGLRPPKIVEFVMNGIMWLEAKTAFPLVLPGLSLVVVVNKEI